MAGEFAGFEVSTGSVRDEWIDINGHVNVAYYLVAFDHGVDQLFDRFGISADYIRTTRGSTFAVECHVTYQRELNRDDPYTVTTQVLAYDQKRIHQFQRLYHAREGYLSATAEWMNLHVDLNTRRVSPWPANIQASIDEFMRHQGTLPLPQEAGRRMHVKTPLRTCHES
jgi:acyl-CoA thioester hydrolase